MEEGTKEQIKKESELEVIEKQAKERTVNLILAGFSFVAGLAWNEAIKSLIDAVFILGTNTLLAKFAYAVLVTILIVIVSYAFSKLNSPKK